LTNTTLTISLPVKRELDRLKKRDGHMTYDSLLRALLTQDKPGPIGPRVAHTDSRMLFTEIAAKYGVTFTEEDLQKLISNMEGWRVPRND